MKRILAIVGVVVGSLAVFSPFSEAQRGVSGTARSVAPAPVAVRSGGGAVVAHSAAIRGNMVSGATHTTVRPVVARPGTVTRVHTVNGVVHITRRNSGTPVRRVRHVSQDLFEDDTNAVPGLGFDFVHFAATHPNAFKRHRGTIGGFIPFFSGGFVMPSVPVVVDEEAADEGEEAVVDEAPRRRIHVMVPEPALAPAANASAESGPVMPSEEYVFVRRDGTVFFAVAYSWENGALRYITNQGLRGTATREMLDLGATQQFNEQRGLNFRAPA